MSKLSTSESDKLFKARLLRNHYKSALIAILEANSNKDAGKRKFPVYFDNWANRILKLDYLIIDLKYKSLT